MKILAVCGHGLGSSFIMEMNIKKALKKLNITGEVGHTDLSSVKQDDADIFVMAKDIASSSNIDPEKIVIVKNLVSVSEFEQKLSEFFSKRG